MKRVRLGGREAVRGVLGGWIFGTKSVSSIRRKGNAIEATVIVRVPAWSVNKYLKERAEAENAGGYIGEAMQSAGAKR